MASAIENLEKMLAGGRDGALLRFSLGSEYLKQQDAAAAAEHFARAVKYDPGYSAAWKMLGRALNEAGRPAEALEAYRQGVAVAENKGDIQAAREMKVFARRIANLMAAKPK